MKQVIKNIWQIIAYPLLFIWIQLLVGFLIAIPIGVLVAFGSISFDDFTQHMVSIAGIPSFALTLLIVWFFLRKQWKAEKMWELNFDTKSMILVAIVSVPLYFSVSFLMTLTRITEMFPGYYELMDAMMGNSIWLDILLIVILAPLVEEVIFRGIVMKRLLDRGVRLPIALMLPALIFGVIHMNVVQGLYAFALGVILGLVYYWVKSIWAPILMHLVFNGLGVTISHISAFADLDTTSGTAGFDGTLLVLTVISLGIAAVLMILIKRRSHSIA